MRTNTERQRIARHRTRIQKAENLAAEIEANYRATEAHLADFRARRDFWSAAEAAGLTAQQMYDLDMELAHGADVADLRASLRQF